MDKLRVLVDFLISPLVLNNNEANESKKRKINKYNKERR